MIDVQTIGEPGETEGYVVFGAKSITAAKAAITDFDNNVTAFPADEAFIHAKCRLECSICEHAHKAPDRQCDGDIESWIWNFHAGRSGRAAIVVLMDGTSILDIYPPADQTTIT